MKHILLILFTALSFSAIGQTVPMTNNVPWYEYSKKLSVGKFMLKSSGEYDTSFTIPSNTASITLDTIAADKTVTFPDGSAYDKGVLMYLENTNNSAFIWNVAGNVKEADGTVISTIPNGTAHIFKWSLNAWIRLSTSGGSSPTVDTLTFSSPLVQLDKNVSLDYDAFPQDTAFVEVTNDSMFNKLYSHTGIRDSTLITRLDYITPDTIISGSLTSYWYYGGRHGWAMSQEGATANRPTLATDVTWLRWNEDSARFEAGDLAEGWRGIAFTDELGSGGGGGTPGGSNKQIQYNNSGSFGGEALFEYDPSTNTLTADTAYFQRIKANWDALGFDGSKDTTLSFDRITGQVIKNIGAGDNAFDGDRKIKIFAGIIRPDVTGSTGQPIIWEWLYPSTNHDTIGFSAPITVSGSGMTINYRTMESVIYFAPTADDELAKNRVNVGASVGIDAANLSFTIQKNVAGYVRGNGSIWVLSGPLTSGIDWAYSSGKFEYKYKTGITNADRESVVANYEGTNGYTIKRNLSGISGSYTGSWSLADQFGNTASITPQTTDIVTMYTGGYYNAAILVELKHPTNTDPYITTGSAVFIMGIFQDLASPNRMYGPITTSNITTTQIQLDWPAATGSAGNYIVKRSTTKNFSSTTTVYTGTNLTYTDTGLTTGTTYYYQVQHTQTSGTVKSDMLFKEQATL